MADGKHNIEAIYPLSPLQEGILFHVLESARPGVYFQQFTCRYLEPIDFVRLRAAWESVVQRHPILRTLLSWERRDKPLQVVRARVDLPWQIEDWRDCSPHEQSARWESLLAQDRKQGFKLDQAPLIRIKLVRVADAESRLLWSFHHALLDGWSMRLLLDEVGRYYRGQSLPTLADIPSYASYIRWLERQDAASAEQYWQQTLSGYSESAAPFFIGRATQSPNDGHATAECRLTVEQLDAISEYARHHRLTLNTLVLGAWALVLGRAARSDDVVFGTTVAGRPTDLTGIDRTAGLFINTLPLRVRIEARRAVNAWLQDIQSSQLSARRFDYSSLSSINRASDLSAGSALFETIVVFENLPETPTSETWALKPHDEHYIEYSNYPFALLAVPGTTLNLMAVYDPSRIDAQRAQQLLECVASTLTAFAGKAKTLGEVAILPAREHEFVVRAFNEAASVRSSTVAAHVQFEQAAARVPQEIAARTPTSSITYSDLNSYANHIARHLIETGVTPGTPVALYMDRSIGAVAAVLGILKAGAAYVPLDPHFPGDRVAAVLADLASHHSGTRAPLIVTQDHLVGQLPASGLSAVTIDRLTADNRMDVGNPDLPIAPAQLAYIIYTSGSTGQPKGVMVSHANLAASTGARAVFYREKPARFLLLSSLATDSSMAGLFWTLASGCTLLLPLHRAEQEMTSLIEWMSTQRVTHTLCVPSLYRVMLEHAGPGQLESLRTVIVAAEACDRHLVNLHHQQVAGVALVNEYGPTEATVWATADRLASDPDPAAPVTIGAPVAGVEVYVLDTTDQPLPIGWPGELHIGGVGVALGYLGKPDETRTRFVSNPFTGIGRLYRTGDLARWRQDGRLEWLGRVDNQIKVRGYRVEPEDIEKTLLTYPAIREAAVVLQSSEPALDTAALARLLAAVDGAEALLAEIEQMSEDELQRALQDGS